MADTVITATMTHPGPTGLRDSMAPALVTGTYDANDTDYHAMIFNTMGKRYITYCVDNPSDKDVTVTIYGAPAITSVVGDPGVFLIGTSVTSSSTSYEEATTDEGAMFFIIRCTSAAASATGTTVTVHAHLMQ